MVQREHCFFPVFYPVFGDIFWQSDRMNPKFFVSCRPTHGRHFEYSCYGGLTNQKIFLSIWKKVFSSFLLLFHVYQTSLRDQYFRFRSSKNQFFLRLVQYLAFYGPDDQDFYIKVTPWPCTKSEIYMWCGCKALRATWRTGNRSFSVQNCYKLVESTLKAIVHFRSRSSKNQIFLRLVQYLAFYGPEDQDFYIKVTPWPYTKSEIYIWCGCKALQATWRTRNRSFLVQNCFKLVESTLKAIVHFRYNL